MKSENINKIDVDRCIFEHSIPERAQIFAGVGTFMSKNTVYDYITNLMRNNPGLRVPPKATIEFIPTFGVPGKLSFRQWLDENNHSQDAKTAFEQFVQASQTNEAQAAMDAYWNSNEFGQHANLYMLPILHHVQKYCVITKNVSCHFSVPQDIQESLKKIIESEYGEGNVYVSNQIQALQHVVDNRQWLFFLQQGWDALFEGITYNRSEYDDQHFVVNEMVIPVFAIPVIIKRGTISRHVDAEKLATEYRKTILSQIHIPSMDEYTRRMVGSPSKDTDFPLWDYHSCRRHLSLFVRQYIEQIRVKDPAFYDDLVTHHKDQLLKYIPLEETHEAPVTGFVNKVVNRFWRR